MWSFCYSTATSNIPSKKVVVYSILHGPKAHIYETRRNVCILQNVQHLSMLLLTVLITCVVLYADWVDRITEKAVRWADTSPEKIARDEAITFNGIPYMNLGGRSLVCYCGKQCAPKHVSVSQ